MKVTATTVAGSVVTIQPAPAPLGYDPALSWLTFNIVNQAGKVILNSAPISSNVAGAILLALADFLEPNYGQVTVEKLEEDQ